jgi:calpain-7
MNDPHSKQLLDTVFSSIEAAKANETANNKNEAIKFYLQAVNTLNIIAGSERDARKKALFAEQIQVLRGEINRLQNNVVKTTNALSSPIIKQAPAPILTLAQADALFEAALNLDEQNKTGPTSEEANQACCDAYIAAAEAYLKLSNKAEANAKRKRVTHILDRVQAIKLRANPDLITSLTDLSDELPVAPQFATAVATNTNPIPKNAPDNTTLLSNANGNLAGDKWAGAAKKSNIDMLVPSASDIANNSVGSLTQMEIEVLRATSVVNGRVFQPWLPGEEERERFRFDHPFCDPDGVLPLSAKQLSAGGEWRRPREFLGLPGVGSPTGDDADTDKNKPTMIELVSPLSIRQDLVSDCSFVCSLCIAAAFEVKFRKKLITSIIYPQNASHKPIYNAYGKYLVKLFINGVERKVIVDDRLPVSASTGELLCSSSINPRELWVSIIEKAYMKVNGGYDFPGSNSGIDLYALTGWIPEHVYFSEDASAIQKHLSAILGDSAVLDHRQSEDRAWERIKSATSFGDCLVTIATGTLTDAEEQETGLVPGHAYAVLDVREAGSLRMMHVKNPWSKRPWKGRFSSTDRKSWTKGLKDHLGVVDADFDKMEKHGLFWIDFDDIRKYFKSFNLSWNPALFAYRISYHDFWKESKGPKNDRYYIGDNPQYCIVVDKQAVRPASSKSAASATSDGVAPVSGTIWLLLSRHVTQTESKETVTNAESRDNRDGDFLSLQVYRLKSMRRLYSNSLPSVKGLYTNDPHILVRVDTDSVPLASCESDAESSASPSPGTDSNDTTFNIVLSQIDKYRDVCYTLSVYSTVPFRFYPAPKPPPHKIEIAGSWAEQTCGGPPSSNKFHRNPQYRLLVGGHTAATVHIQILFSKDISAAIDVCKGGSRMDHISDSELVVSSGAYRSGYCYVECTLQPGTYAIVLSTYTKEMLGRFMCTLQSSVSTVGLAEIPPEGQTGFKMAVRGEWRTDDGTAAGCNNHGRYDKNPVYVFTLPGSGAPSTDGSAGIMMVTARLCSVSDHCTAPMNLSFYDLSSGVAIGSLLPPRANPKTANFTSNKGVYSNKSTGVICEHIGLTVGPQWAMVPSTFDPAPEQFDIFISFSTNIKVNVQRIQ